MVKSKIVKNGQLYSGLLRVKLWADRWISNILDLYENDNRLSFNEIKQTLSIDSKHFFKYLQIRSFITKTQNSIILPCQNSSEKTVQSSKFYQIIMAAGKESSEDKRLACCSDLDEEITVEEWQDICFQCQAQTINTRFKLLQYKWLMRTHFTPELLHRIYPSTPDTVSNPAFHKGSMFHCLWECTHIQEFWKEIIIIISIFIKEQLPFCPKLCFFGCFPASCTFSNSSRKILSS